MPFQVPHGGWYVVLARPVPGLDVNMAKINNGTDIDRMSLPICLPIGAVTVTIRVIRIDILTDTILHFLGTMFVMELMPYSRDWRS